MLGENSSSPLRASGGCGSPWHLRVAAVPASLLPCVSLHTSLSLRGHQSLNSGTVLLQYDFFLNSIASLMTPFPRKVVLMGMAALGHIFPEKKQPTQTSFLRHASGIGSLLATSSVTAAVLATVVSLLRALRPPGGLPAPATVHLHPMANMVFPKHKSVFPLGPKTKVERPPHLTLRRLPAGLGVTPRPRVAAFSAHWLTAASFPPLNTLDFLRSLSGTHWGLFLGLSA